MKKVILVILLVGVVFAQANQDKYFERINLMQNLEISMAIIQKGYLYNDSEIVKKGIEKLKYYTKNVSSFEVQNDQDSSFNAKQYALNEASAISGLATKMLKNYKARNKSAVLTACQNTLNRCVTCHMIVRKW